MHPNFVRKIQYMFMNEWLNELYAWIMCVLLDSYLERICCEVCELWTQAQSLVLPRMTELAFWNWSKRERFEMQNAFGDWSQIFSITLVIRETHRTNFLRGVIQDQFVMHRFGARKHQHAKLLIIIYKQSNLLEFRCFYLRVSAKRLL